MKTWTYNPFQIKHIVKILFNKMVKFGILVKFAIHLSKVPTHFIFVNLNSVLLIKGNDFYAEILVITFL